MPNSHLRMRRPTAAASLLALVLAFVPASQAEAASSFTFYGSGWGHGLGLSQWGAFGMAQQGWMHGPILMHFYTGTKLSVDKTPPKKLRVGLTQGRLRVTLTAISGPVRLWTTSPKGVLVGKIPNGKTWSVHAEPDGYRVLDGSGKRVGGHDWGGTSHNLYATWADPGARVKIPQGGGTYAHGLVEFNLYDCRSGCVMRLILQIAPEQYLLGIGEVPSSWPMQALEAQAIASRTYAIAKVAYGQHRMPCNCGLYDTSYDQVYMGWAKESGFDGSRWVHAVKATAGTVVTYRGTPIQAFFFSSSGGATENNENVWGGTPIPYLRGVCDPGDYTPENPSAVWRSTFTAGWVTSALSPYTGGIGTIKGFTSIKRGVSGRIISAVANGTKASHQVTGQEIQAALGLRDDKTWINSDKNVTGPIRLKYDNLMCAPGLPTTPRRSVPGGTTQAFATGAIYRNPKASVTVWLKGAMKSDYDSLGGAKGVLGIPTSNVAGLSGFDSCGGSVSCSRVSFAHGRIYFKEGRGAHGLWGNVLQSYLSHGGAQGMLGFPTSDVNKASDGTASATFEHGKISCPSGGGTCRVS